MVTRAASAVIARGVIATASRSGFAVPPSVLTVPTAEPDA
jgi:hypothetical protein